VNLTEDLSLEIVEGGASEMDRYEVVIIGGGPAGLTAGIYVARSRLRALLLEAAFPGGNAALTDQIDNYPGFPFGISGPELADRFRQQAERLGLEIRIAEAKKIALEGDLKRIDTDKGSLVADIVIVAAGVRRRELGVPGETELVGKGVSYCATCDGPFFENRRVAVVGGGDSAVEEALYLSGLAERVYLVHRRDALRANRMAQEKLLANNRIELKLNRVVERLEGEKMLKALVLKDTVTGDLERLEVDGAFVSIGMKPALEFLGNLVELKEGYIVTDENMHTSVPGILAAGDIRYKTDRQIATAVGDGAIAGMEAVRLLENRR